MSQTVEVAKRDLVGSLAVKRLRRAGQIPAILYGHGEANVCLSVNRDVITKVIHHGTKMVSLTGAVKEEALVRDVQWDSFGIEVIHVDFTRVSSQELVDLVLPVELHGEAPGTKEGGVVRLAMHELHIKCPASKLPEHIIVNVSGLHMGQAIHASDVILPPGAKLVTPGAEVVVQIAGVAAVDETAADLSGAEPELIRKEKEEEPS